MIDKKIIRKALLKKRNTLTEKECQKYSKLIEKQILSSVQYLKSDTLLIYASYQKEVSTYGIIDHALYTGKKVFCPTVISPGIMEFYEIVSFKDVVSGYKNIPEPKRTDFPYSSPDSSKTLMLMPLVGFDTQKNRLGYGGGFYDRYLQRFPDIERIGLAFECQRYESVFPMEETDIRPDFIITESNVY